MTITPKEYTKHYYMNGERLASSIGGGGLCAMSPDVISITETHHEEYLFNTLDIYKNAYPYEYPEEEMPQLTQNVDIHDIFYNDLHYLCPYRLCRRRICSFACRSA